MVALAQNGKVYSIGRGEYGRLGHGGSEELHEWVTLVGILLLIVDYYGQAS